MSLTPLLLLALLSVGGQKEPADSPRICDTLPVNATGTIDRVWVPPPPQPGYWRYTKYPGTMTYGAGGDRPYRAYAKLDIEAMSESLDISYAAFHYYQPNSASGCSTRLMLLEADPVTTGAARLWDLYLNGIAETMDNSSAGWHRAELLANGIQHLEWSIPQGWYAVGILTTSGLGHADGLGGTNPPFLEVGYARTCDIGGVDCELTEHRLQPSDEIRCRVDFTNRGRYPSPVLKVHAELDGNVIDSLLLPGAAPGDTFTADFTLPAHPAGRALLRFWVGDSLDANPADDTIGYLAWVFPDTALLTEDFEDDLLPPDWRSINADGGSSSWNVETRPAHSDSRVAWCGREIHGRNDDWLVTAPFTPGPHATDSLGFFASVPGLYREVLDVWVMSGPTLADTLGLLASYELESPEFEPLTACLDDYDGRTIRLGFRLGTYSGDGLAIDDICVATDPVPGVASPQAPRVAVSRVWPNPVRRNGRVRLEWPRASAPGQLVLRDVSGRVVRHRPVRHGETGATLELRNLSPGCYFVETGLTGPARLKLVVTSR